MNDILDRLGEIGIIPVVTIDDAADASGLGRALTAGELPCAEITFRTPAAGDAIRALAADFPDMLIGAGTVLTVRQAEAAVAAGAGFIVSPGFDPEVIDWCLAQGVPVTPGVLTPSEISAAVKKGLTLLKFFPAEAAGGIAMLRALGAPFPGLSFIPTGGISMENLGDYIRLPMVHACGGSWLATKQLIAGGDFDRITALARAAVQAVRDVRGVP